MSITNRTEATVSSRVGTLEREIAVLQERIKCMGGTVDTNEGRVDKLRIFMWKASGILGLITMIPLGLTIFNMLSNSG